jgi:diguanylate cyclase (GGDEF)-like protein
MVWAFDAGHYCTTITCIASCLITANRRDACRQAEAKIMHMARHDALTNLPNRVLFRDKMEQALGRGEKLAVMFLDLDRFKGVNDSLGHSVGDALLCAVTERLQRVVRGVDTVARLGGDEFAIVQSSARPTDASELAAELIETFSEPFEVHGHQVIIGTSIGIAMASADGNEPDQLLRWGTKHRRLLRLCASFADRCAVQFFDFGNLRRRQFGEFFLSCAL